MSTYLIRGTMPNGAHSAWKHNSRCIETHHYPNVYCANKKIDKD